MFYLVCEILIKLDIEWQVVPKELRLKCRTRLDNDKLVCGGSDDKDDEEAIKQFLRKDFLKLYITIHKFNEKNNVAAAAAAAEETYMLDILLFKGNLLVFSDFIEKFLKSVHGQCTIIPHSSREEASPLNSNSITRVNTANEAQPVQTNYNIQIL